MKDIRTLPIEWFKEIAELKNIITEFGFSRFKGDFRFINLFEPALKEVDDETIITLLYSVSTRYSIQLFLPSHEFLTLNEIYLIAEYFKRRLKTLKEEEEEPTIQGRHYDIFIQDDLGNDKYSSYSVDQYQIDIDWYCKRSLEAQLAGDRVKAAYFTSLASDLTRKQEILQRKINSLKNTKGS